MAQPNAVVGQSGGPTSVINASLAGVIGAAAKSKKIGRVFGLRFAIEGLLAGQLVDLNAQPAHTLKHLPNTPSSALGSSRYKLRDEDLPQVLDRLKEFNIRYFFMIGGNDTMDTIHRVTDFANAQGYELIGVGVPKTVDNDLFGTDHTPGYPSAARYVALSVLQGGTLARDMQRVDQFVIYQAVGRSAGWLAAAAALDKRDPDDAPHLILLPERPFDRDAFLAAVKKTKEEHGYCSIVCGEGITYADGTPVSASQTRDKFNNVEFGAMGGTSAAMMLHRMISEAFGWRGEFQIVESLQMCAADRAVRLDVQEAVACGKQAVKLAEKSTSGVMATLNRVSKGRQPYKTAVGTIELSRVANAAKPMPDEMIRPDGMGVTAAFLKYAQPLVGPMPQHARLKMNLVPSRAKKTTRRRGS